MLSELWLSLTVQELFLNLDIIIYDEFYKTS